jgi:hypothetical protein
MFRENLGAGNSLIRRKGLCVRGLGKRYHIKVRRGILVKPPTFTKAIGIIA